MTLGEKMGAPEGNVIWYSHEKPDFEDRFERGMRSWLGVVFVDWRLSVDDVVCAALVVVLLLLAMALNGVAFPCVSSAELATGLSQELRPSSLLW